LESPCPVGFAVRTRSLGDVMIGRFGRNGHRTASGRAERAMRRDAVARSRDLAARARDELAEGRDDAAALLDRELGDREGSSRAARVRVWAAADRARAANDREQAAIDREHAALDRAHAKAQLERAQLDGLTGAYRRPMGELELTNEIARARRSDGRLVLAFVDVDSLKERNDRQGHAAGDALLRIVVSAIRSNIRSYDPIVRFGGDEFVCGLSNTDLDGARRRFDAIRDAIREADDTGSISVGLAELGPSDTLRDLTARGDAALYRAKHENGHRRNGDVVSAAGRTPIS
jgi:diguanylate cyclase (GGDEF)-like protein